MRFTGSTRFELAVEEPAHFGRACVELLRQGLDGVPLPRQSGFQIIKIGVSSGGRAVGNRSMISCLMVPLSRVRSANALTKTRSSSVRRPSDRRRMSAIPRRASTRLAEVNGSYGSGSTNARLGSVTMSAIGAVSPVGPVRAARGTVMTRASPSIRSARFCVADTRGRRYRCRGMGPPCGVSGP